MRVKQSKIKSIPNQTEVPMIFGDGGYCFACDSYNNFDVLGTEYNPMAKVLVKQLCQCRECKAKWFDAIPDEVLK